jgi:hypothetical protein
MIDCLHVHGLTITPPPSHQTLELASPFTDISRAEEESELSKDSREFLSAGCVVLPLHKAIECGDKRARYVIRLQTHDSVGIWMRAWG